MFLTGVYVLQRIVHGECCSTDCYYYLYTFLFNMFEKKKKGV